ncbi:MAG TPA: hypothetical protein VGP12_10805 [Nitrosospira sp.]|nr:hypothetical protein [Nitrosospira sp.]
MKSGVRDSSRIREWDWLFRILLTPAPSVKQVDGARQPPMPGLVGLIGWIGWKPAGSESTVLLVLLVSLVPLGPMLMPAQLLRNEIARMMDSFFMAYLH